MVAASFISHDEGYYLDITEPSKYFKAVSKLSSKIAASITSPNKHFCKFTKSTVLIIFALFLDKLMKKFLEAIVPAGYCPGTISCGFPKIGVCLCQCGRSHEMCLSRS